MYDSALSKKNVPVWTQRWLMSHLNDTHHITKILATHLQPRDVLCFTGPLGVGKTTFIRSLIHKLTHSTENVPSPTFTLVQLFQTPLGTLWHFDLFRILESDEIIELGWEEALSSGLVIVEWPERLGDFLPQNRLHITLNFFTFFEEFPEGRWLSLAGYGTWTKRLASIPLKPYENL